MSETKKKIQTSIASFARRDEYDKIEAESDVQVIAPIAGINNRFIWKELQSRRLKTLINVFSEYVSETNILFSPEGIRFLDMDCSHIGLCNIFLDKEDIDQYKCEEEFEIGMNMEDFSRIFTSIKRNDTIIIRDELTSDYKFRVNISAFGEYTRNHILETIQDIDENKINLDALSNIEYKNTFYVKQKDFQSIIKDCNLYAESVDIEASTSPTTSLHILKMSTSGNIGDYTGYPKSILNNEDEFKEAKGTFAINFLKRLNALSDINKSEPLQIKLDNEKPLRIRKDFGVNSYIELFIAPRIEEDDKDW